MDSLSSCTNNLGRDGNDTISRMVESTDKIRRMLPIISMEKLNDMKDILTESSSESSSASESDGESASESSSPEESSSQESSSLQESPAESEQPSSSENGDTQNQSSNNEEAAAIPADDAAEYLAAGDDEAGDYAWFARDSVSRNLRKKAAPDGNCLRNAE